jgi:hypothetical protein
MLFMRLFKNPFGINTSCLGLCQGLRRDGKTERSLAKKRLVDIPFTVLIIAKKSNHIHLATIS